LAGRGAAILNASPPELPSAEALALESATLFASLAYAKLSEESRDLDEARFAIEALRALVAVLPEDKRKDLQAVTANLQLAYADAAG
jgi:hypothetical protein